MRGGHRAGAGRKVERLSPALTRTHLDALRLPGESWADLARRLGIARQAVSRALVKGATARTLTGWALSAGP